MNCIIPFESKVKFDGPVKEICTISLEHEITENDERILGNFIIEGTYKEHELSVNTFDFKFTIPFEVELNCRIASDTLDFAIDNFTYDIKDDEMTVKIDYIVNADEIEEREEDIIEEEKEEIDPLDLIDEKIEENDSIKEKNSEKEQEDSREIAEEEKSSSEDERVGENIISGIKTEDDYISFKIHIVKEDETIEGISIANKIDKDEILMINDISGISPGDKILIPKINE